MRERYLSQLDSTTNYTVTHSFFDKEGNPFPFYGLVGILDIDNSDYLFDSSKSVYYQDGQGNEGFNNDQFAADNFLFTSSGLERDRSKCTDDGFGGFKDANLFLPLENESSISVKIKAWASSSCFLRASTSTSTASWAFLDSFSGVSFFFFSAIMFQFISNTASPDPGKTVLGLSNYLPEVHFLPMCQFLPFLTR